MPTTPSSSAIAPAIASITSVNDVRAIDALTTSSSVRTLASGRFGFTDQTARLTSLANAVEPARGLRITYDIVRPHRDRRRPRSASIIIGQKTIVGAFWSTPSSRSSPTTPTTSRQAALRVLADALAERRRRLLPQLARQVLGDHHDRPLVVGVRPT